MGIGFISTVTSYRGEKKEKREKRQVADTQPALGADLLRLKSGPRKPRKFGKTVTRVDVKGLRGKTVFEGIRRGPPKMQSELKNNFC